MEKSADAFRTISEVSDVLGTPAHVLRFWESRFPQIRPVKRAGGRRYYRPSDVALLGGIKRLLHDEGLTIRGVQKVLREQGIRHVAGLALAGAAAAVAELDEDPAEPAVTDPPKTGQQRRKAADRTPPANAPPVPPPSDTRPGRDADPLPLWVAAVDRVGSRSNGPSSPPGPSEAGAEAIGAIWLPSVLRTLSPAVVAEHRDRLTDIRARLLALRNRVADAARQPAP
jgi:DNA-binding transcriptional MerR regulator